MRFEIEALLDEYYAEDPNKVKRLVDALLTDRGAPDRAIRNRQRRGDGAELR